MTLKSILLLSGIICLFACKTRQENITTKAEKPIISSLCPEEGKCSIDVLLNSSLLVKKDGIGKLYPEINEGDKKVLKFEFERNQDPRIADDGYREVIYMELDPDIESLQLQDEELRQAKVLFGRLCFCGDQAGYFPVQKGNLNVIASKDKSVTYSLEFEVDKIPQKIKNFSITR